MQNRIKKLTEEEIEKIKFIVDFVFELTEWEFVSVEKYPFPVEVNDNSVSSKIESGGFYNIVVLKNNNKIAVRLHAIDIKNDGLENATLISCSEFTNSPFLDNDEKQIILDHTDPAAYQDYLKTKNGRK